MRIVELDEKEFGAWSAKSAGRSFLQSLEMYRRYVSQGREVYLLGLKQGEKILAASLVMKSGEWWGRKIFNAPRGFLLDYEKDDYQIMQAMTQGMRRFLKSRGGMILKISPNWGREVEVKKDGGLVPGQYWSEGEKWKKALGKMGYKNLGEYEQVKWIYTMNLEGRTAEEIYAGFRSGHKWSIRYAKERYGLTVRELKANELDLFKEVTKLASEKHGFNDPGLEYYQEMKKFFGEKVKFIVTEMNREVAEREGMKCKDEKIVTAGAMFVVMGGEVIYLFSGAREDYKKFGGPHLIQWEMIQEAVRKNCQKYNFYGTQPLAGEGVYAFKRGFRGQMEELLGTFMLPMNFWGRIYCLKQRYREFGRIE